MSRPGNKLNRNSKLHDHRSGVDTGERTVMVFTSNDDCFYVLTSGFYLPKCCCIWL